MEWGALVILLFIICGWYFLQQKELPGEKFSSYNAAEENNFKEDITLKKESEPESAKNKFSDEQFDIENTALKIRLKEKINEIDKKIMKISRFSNRQYMI